MGERPGVEMAELPSHLAQAVERLRNLVADLGGNRAVKVRVIEQEGTVTHVVTEPSATFVVSQFMEPTINHSRLSRLHAYLVNRGDIVRERIEQGRRVFNLYPVENLAIFALVANELGEERIKEVRHFEGAIERVRGMLAT